MINTISNIELNIQTMILNINTDEKIKNRLIAMGLYIGGNICVISRTKIGNNVIIEIGLEHNKTRIMLNKKESELIVVK